MMAVVWRVAGFHPQPISVIRPYPPMPKYIQGIEFGNGNLFYGTNDGKIVCVGRDEAKLRHRWSVPITSRSIHRIQTTHKYLLASCDTVRRNETGRSVLCDIQTGSVLDVVSWADTTMFEAVTFGNEWIRVNMRGDILGKAFPRDGPFSLKLRLPLGSSDYVLCGTMYKEKLYLMTMNGNLWVVNIEPGVPCEVLNRYATRFQFATTIHVTEPLRSENSAFVYVGNQDGDVYFTQLTEGECVSHTQRRLHPSVVTQIESNSCGLFIAFQDSTIVAMEIISFREVMRVHGNAHFYPNVDAFSLSPRGIFYISDNERCIRVKSLEKM